MKKYTNVTLFLLTIALFAFCIACNQQTDPDPDSSEWHGYGTYRLSNDVVIETLSSMSLPLKEEFNDEVEFELKTEYGKNFMKQEMPVPYRETIYQYVEEWKKLN